MNDFANSKKRMRQKCLTPINKEDNPKIAFHIFVIVRLISEGVTFELPFIKI